MKTIAVFGETLWDILPTGSVLGGAPCNFAYRAHSLGYHAPLISAVGRDELGREALRLLGTLGMEIDHIQVHPTAPTGTVDVTLDESGQPDYVINPGVAYDEVDWRPDLEILATEADAFCFGVLAQRAEKSRETAKRFLEVLGKRPDRPPVFLDINLRKDCYTDEIIRSSLRVADILKLNEEEAETLSRTLGLEGPNPLENCRAILEDWDLDHLIVTLGERGAFCTSARGPAVYEPGYRVRLVDPLGSGDAFSAGFLTSYLDGKDVSECLHIGNVLGAIVATQQGATAPIDPSHLPSFSASNTERIADPAWEQLAKSEHKERAT